MTTLSNEELVALIQADTDRTNNLESLYIKNMGLLIALCKQYGAGEDIDDLLQESYFSVETAARMYDQTSEGSFAGYLRLWVRQGIIRYRENNGSSVRIPVHQHQRIRQYRRTINLFQTEYGRDPSPAELAAALGLTVDRIEDLRSDLRFLEMRSLNELISEEGDELSELVPGDVDIEEEVTNRIYVEELRAALEQAIDYLTAQEAAVIRGRYLSDGGRPTYKTMADDMGKSQARIRQLELSGMRKLRSGKPRNILRYYVDVYSMGIRGTGVDRFRQTNTSATEYAALKLVELSARS